MCGLRLAFTVSRGHTLSNGASWAYGGCVSVPGSNVVMYDCCAVLRGSWPGPYAIHAKGIIYCSGSRLRADGRPCGHSRGGKFRLLYALRQRLAGARVIYLTGRCLLYGSTIPYYPLMDFVRTSVSQNQTGNTPYL